MYLDAEAEDGYYRDRNVFAPGVTIEDDMALLVSYDTGATDSSDGVDIADARQAALALVTGLAANRSFETGQPVRTADVLKL
ncbi:hypothetical protein [Kribbella steppae]|uniref:hypothetical protein n=1 Tax=Kribbella steppae TaxID=2512223 RepID=UPI0018EEA730|nr:hypothetical protein [Kribbella steppae]